MDTSLFLFYAENLIKKNKQWRNTTDIFFYLKKRKNCCVQTTSH